MTALDRNNPNHADRIRKLEEANDNGEIPPPGIPVFGGIPGSKEDETPRKVLPHWTLLWHALTAWVLVHRHPEYYACPRQAGSAPGPTGRKKWERHILPRLQFLCAFHTVALMGWNTYYAWTHAGSDSWLTVTPYGGTTYINGTTGSTYTTSSVQRRANETCSNLEAACSAIAYADMDAGWVAKLFLYGRLSIGIAMPLICFHFFVLFERKKDNLPKAGDSTEPLMGWEKRREAVAGTNYLRVILAPISAFLCKLTWCRNAKEKVAQKHLRFCPARLSVRKRDRGPMCCWFLVVGFLTIQWVLFYMGLNTLPSRSANLEDGEGVFVATLWVICASWCTHQWKQASREEIAGPQMDLKGSNGLELADYWLPKQMLSEHHGEFASRNADRKGPFRAPVDSVHSMVAKARTLGRASS